MGLRYDIDEVEATWTSGFRHFNFLDSCIRRRNGGGMQDRKLLSYLIRSENDE
jgi:hypothetical protein